MVGFSCSRYLAMLLKSNTLVSDHVDIAETLNALAKAHRGQGRDDQAEPLLLRVLAIREKSLGPDHPSTKEARDTLDALRAAK
jgi:hypothetical protein